MKFLTKLHLITHILPIFHHFVKVVLKKISNFYQVIFFDRIDWSNTDTPLWISEQGKTPSVALKSPPFDIFVKKEYIVIVFF